MSQSVVALTPPVPREKKDERLAELEKRLEQVVDHYALSNGLSKNMALTVAADILSRLVLTRGREN